MAPRPALPALLLLALLAAAGPCASARHLLQAESNGGSAGGPPAVSIPPPGQIAGFLLRQIISLLDISQPLSDILSFDLPSSSDATTSTDDSPADSSSSSSSSAADGSEAPAADGPAADGPPGPPPRPGVLLGTIIRDVLTGVSGAGGGPGVRQGVSATGGPNPKIEVVLGPELSLVPGLSVTGAEYNPGGTLAAKGLDLTLSNNLGLEGALQPQGSLTKSGSIEAPAVEKTYKAPAVEVEGGDASKTVVQAASGKADAGGFANGLAAAAAAAKAKAAGP